MPESGTQRGSEPRATIVVAPRERFSSARASLESVFANTAAPYELIYPDGRSPRYLRSWLEEQSRARGFELLRYDRYLRPNEARNIGFARVQTEYVLFLDNDVLVRPGWLDKMVKCADETGAAIVTPLTYEGDFHAVHVAGGELEIREDGDSEDGRHLHEELWLHEERIEPDDVPIERCRCGLAEAHCMLVRSDALRGVGGLDEEMLSTRDHIDLCLEVSAAGGEIWFEPQAVVSCLTAAAWSASTPFPRLQLRDIPYYSLRWSDEWERRSLEHFRTKWGLPEDDSFQARLQRLGWRRRMALVRPVARRLTLGRGTRRVEGAIQPLERRLNHWLTRWERRVHEGASGGASAVPAGRR